MLGLVQAAQVGVEDFLIKQAFKKRKGLTAEQSKVFHNLFDDMGIGEPTETRHLRVQWPESTIDLEKTGGTEVYPAQIVAPPEVGFRIPNNGLKWKHEQKRFTILVADLDANPKEKATRCFLNYIAVNVRPKGENGTERAKGKNKMMEFGKGNIVTKWIPPRATPQTNSHRIIVLLFMQENKLDDVYINDKTSFDLVNEFNPSLEAKDVKQRIGFNLEDFTQVNDLELHAVNFFTSVYESPEKEKARLEKLKLEAELGVDNDENGRRAIGVNKRSAATIFSQTNFEKKSNRQIAWEEKGGGKKDEGEDASKSACCTAM
mmetsp:Transcript_18689/g.29708  ORF Transcript_18689/g.29708 Transcript_18689/m.29708 type:complete len:318 (-) Transcript_18689:381-1334(-)